MSMYDINDDGFVDPGVYDTNGDDVGDVNVLDTTGEGIGDTVYLDADQDGVRNAVAYDTNGDTTYDTMDIDLDRDGVEETRLIDTDGDGIPDSRPNMLIAADGSITLLPEAPSTLDAGPFGLDIIADLPSFSGGRMPVDGGSGSGSMPVGEGIGGAISRSQNPVLDDARDASGNSSVLNPSTATTDIHRDGQLTPNT